MENFFMQYTPCMILCAVGLFFVIVSYAALFSERSGVPFFGGLLITIGFLTSPHKWLALLALVDYGFWYLPYLLIKGHITQRRFERFCKAHGYAESKRDDRLTLRIYIPERDEELLWNYVTRSMYRLNIPKLLFAICTDSSGKHFLLVDRLADARAFEISEFEGQSTTMTGLTAEGKDYTVNISIIDQDNK